MKIKITTTRRPRANGEAQPCGAEIEVDDKTGARLKELGFAEGVKGRPKKEADDDA